MAKEDLSPLRSSPLKGTSWWTRLDIHLDGWPLQFWPKWVFNIIKLSMQIHSFWQYSRLQSPKTALFWAIIQIERALFVSFYSISTQDKATFGQSEIRRDVFEHTAKLQHSKGTQWPKLRTKWKKNFGNNLTTQLKFLRKRLMEKRCYLRGCNDSSG